MGYAQDIQIKLTTKSKTRTYTVKEAAAYWGKFYESSKDDEITADQVNGKSIKTGSDATIKSCGRSDAASGTEGVFSVYDGSIKCGVVYWNCPWKAGTSNTIQIRDHNDEYAIMVGPYNQSGPDIGYVVITLSKTD